MCGICGVVAPVTSRLRIDADLITRMRDVMRHRGPDGAGIHLAEGVGLGHRRLSIIDVAHGQQPMFSDDRSAVLVYNGEIFNHPDLMRTLEDQGQHYRTRCDTETVLRLYARDDVDAPRAMRGMFAFAIWNHARRELLLARDRFGVKPLYYVHRDDGTLFFASEIKSLLAGGAASATLNMAAFPDYLANHAPSGTETLFAGVRRLIGFGRPPSLRGNDDLANAESLEGVVDGLFAVAAVGGHGARFASGPFDHPLDGRFEPGGVGGVAGLHVVVEDDAVVVVADLGFGAELDRLADSALPDRSCVWVVQADPAGRAVGGGAG